MAGVVALGLGLASGASAVPGSGTLFGTNGVQGDLITVNTGTGAGTFIGWTGTGSIPALATDPVTGILYAASGGGSPVLYELDKTTGAIPPSGGLSLGLAGLTGVGDMDFRDNGDGTFTLYATLNIVGGGNTGSETLATINTATGAVTVIGALGVEGMEGLAFAPDGTLWGAQTLRGALDIPRLFTINPATGAATPVAQILDSFGVHPSGGIASLRFGDDGTLYGGTARDDGTTFDGGRLVIIETIDDDTTPPGRFFFVEPDGPATALDPQGLQTPLAALAFDVDLAVNECTDNTDNCSPNATCMDTPEAYDCACNAGFSGTGFICNDIDECADNTDNCSANATCTNTAGEFECACNAGFSGDGVTCTSAPAITALGPARLWLGLKNSDDQGTQFDIRVELLKNGAPVAEGLTRCVTGLTRNPSFAKEVAVPFDGPPPGILATGDVLALRVSTRIGTTLTGLKCPGPGGSHNAARGLRLYYDGMTRPSRFAETIEPNPSEDEYLHSNGGICPGGGGESPSVTNRYLDSTAPTAASPKCKDAGTVNFAGGNPFAVVGTWSAAPLP